MRGLLNQRMIILVCLAFFSIITNNRANHIIGGMMRYECQGDGDFRIFVNMYRDCNCSGCANFDTDASIAVYNCGNSTNCSNLMQGSTIPNGVIALNYDGVRNVAPPVFPCLIPPDICVSEAAYDFSTRTVGMELEQNGIPYIFTYQRCCRNDGIVNLVPPSDDNGSTFSIILTPEALALCNSSPVFNSFPPTVVCNNFLFEYDHGASDIDGDSLVYYFCAPFDGGDNDVSDQFINTCNGAKPTPSCPPDRRDGTYNTVPYQLPFSGENPLPGTIAIDRQTGFMSGVPDQAGRFVVGVCIDEFRGDTLLSNSRRDFQFNIETCDPEVDSRINSDSVVAGVEFVFTNCGDFEVFFENQSERREFIDDWFWRFDINGEPLEITTWDATVNFPDTGFYSGLLVLNPSSVECSDTAIISVNINPRIVSDFEIQYDTCFGFPVQFQNRSFSDGGGISSYRWDFGDGNMSSLMNPNHLYERPGSYVVSLSVVDVRNCMITSEQTIDFFPVPLNIIIDPLPSDICAPVTVLFENLSKPLDSTYTVLWDFGDGNMSTGISPTHIYSEAGEYDVSVIITSSNGCVQDANLLNFVSVIESAEAEFDFTPEKPRIDAPTVTFLDKSKRAEAVSWDFNNLASSSERNPMFTFPDTGHFQVSQYAFHQNGCIDTAQAIVFVRSTFSYFLPNAFTPNGDGRNDTYIGVGNLTNTSSFTLSIWNRWGEKVFESRDPNMGWNGRKNNEGILSQPGVYICYVSFVDGDGVRQEIKSYATLIQ